MTLNKIPAPETIIPGIICAAILAAGFFFLHPKTKTAKPAVLLSKTSTGWQQLAVLPAGTPVTVTAKEGSMLLVSSKKPPLSGWVDSRSAPVSGGLLHKLYLFSRNGGYSGTEKPLLQIRIDRNSQDSYAFISVLAPFAILIGLLTLVLSGNKTVKSAGSALFGCFLLVYLLFSGGLLRQQQFSGTPAFDPSLVIHIKTHPKPVVFCNSPEKAALASALLGTRARIMLVRTIPAKANGYAFATGSPGAGWSEIASAGKTALYFRE